MAWYLCAAGTTLRRQIDQRWPGRDKAYDGSVGDTSHQAAVSDHNPDYSSNPPGVVRAIDVDEDLAKGDPDAMFRLVNQLREYCEAGKDHQRVAYIIYEGKITSGTYASSYWKWRTYTGSNSHSIHAHISFTRKGDNLGGKFDLRIFGADLRRKRTRLRKELDNIAARIRALRTKREAKRRALTKL